MQHCDFLIFFVDGFRGNVVSGIGLLHSMEKPFIIE